MCLLVIAFSCPQRLQFLIHPSLLPPWKMSIIAIAGNVFVLVPLLTCLAGLGAALDVVASMHSEQALTRRD